MHPTIEAEFSLRESHHRGYPTRVFEQLPQFLAQHFSKLSEHEAAEFVVTEQRRWTFGDVRRAAGGIARLLNGRGIEPGDRVALALPNSAEWIASFIAVSSIGAVPALINPRSAPEELKHCVESIDCRTWLASEHPPAPHTLNTPEVSWLDLQQAIDNASDEPLPVVTRSSEDEALILFTSGTTGRAKAASLTHESVLTALKTIQYSSALIAAQMAEKYGMDYDDIVALRPPPVTLLMFPLFHVSGCHAVFLNNLLQGGRIVLLSRWDPQRALDLIESEKITAFPGVPTMYWDLLGAQSESPRDISSLTNVSVGGQATPATLLSTINERLPQTVMGTGYGMTETNGTVTLLVGEDFSAQPSAVGRAVSTMDLEIRDEHGTALPIGEPGEVCVRGTALMSGYVNVDGSPFDEHGWFATGDIGVLSDEGILSIVDRKTDMVISGGENIYCAEVERAIDQHPAIRESAAYGEPDERLGERVVAVACLEEGADVGHEEVLASLDVHLARYKLPKRLTLTREPLPRNPSGKIVKALVRELVEGEQV